MDIALDNLRATLRELAKEILPDKPKFAGRAPGHTETDTAALLKLAASSALFGVLLHQTFMRVELDRYPLCIVAGFIAIFCMQAFGLREFSAEFAPTWAGWQLALLVQAAALTSLTGNILVYRAWLHPLHDFPGPFGAKLSKVWSLRQVVKSGVRYYRVLGGLQEEYGDYVRTGPREITVFDANAIAPVLSFSSKAKKGVLYGAMQESVHMTRDHDFHAKRRKVWDFAFKQTLSDYGPIIEEFTDTFLAQIENAEGHEVLINKLCQEYTYDVMSSLAFGSSTQFMEGKSTKIAKKVLADLTGGVAAIGAFLHLPWVLTIVESIAVLGGPMKGVNEWAESQVKQRRTMKNARPDIIGHLIKHAEDTREGRALVISDARTIIAGGSDTTKSLLSIIFVLLATYPEYQHALFKEVSASFEESTYNSAKPQAMLDDIIAEALRLFPPVLFQGQRVAPEGGLKIGNVLIPEDTIIDFATYQIQRDPRNFVQPNEFIPERWSSKPELVLNKTAFFPFSTGPFNCPGKGLAMMETRSVIARTVYKYDVLIPDREKFNEEMFYDSIRDHMSIGIPDCVITFKNRR